MKFRNIVSKGLAKCRTTFRRKEEERRPTTPDTAAASPRTSSPEGELRTRHRGSAGNHPEIAHHRLESSLNSRIAAVGDPDDYKKVFEEVMNARNGSVFRGTLPASTVLKLAQQYQSLKEDSEFYNFAAAQLLADVKRMTFSADTLEVFHIILNHFGKSDGDFQIIKTIVSALHDSSPEIQRSDALAEKFSAMFARLLRVTTELEEGQAEVYRIILPMLARFDDIKLKEKSVDAMVKSIEHGDPHCSAAVALCLEFVVAEFADDDSGKEAQRRLAGQLAAKLRLLPDERQAERRSMAETIKTLAKRIGDPRLEITQGILHSLHEVYSDTELEENAFSLLKGLPQNLPGEMLRKTLTQLTTLVEFLGPKNRADFVFGMLGLTEHLKGVNLYNARLFLVSSIVFLSKADAMKLLEALIGELRKKEPTKDELAMFQPGQWGDLIEAIKGALELQNDFDDEDSIWKDLDDMEEKLVAINE